MCSCGCSSSSTPVVVKKCPCECSCTGFSLSFRGNPLCMLMRSGPATINNYPGNCGCNSKCTNPRSTNPIPNGTGNCCCPRGSKPVTTPVKKGCGCGGH